MTRLFLGLADTSSGKRFPRIAFAGGLETLSWQESALGAKIRMSERSEFGFLPLFLADFCKLRVSGSETRNPGEPFSRAYPSEQSPVNYSLKFMGGTQS